MKVIVGASSFAQADDAPLRKLEAHGIEVVLNPYKRRMNADEITELLQDADGLLAGLEPLDETVLKNTPRLKALARIGIGMDNVDIAFAESQGIRVSNTPEGPTQAVAEMSLAALLSLLRNLISFNNDLHQGRWDKQIGSSILGLKVLLIGYGRTGKRFGDMLQALGAEVMACDPNVSDETNSSLRLVSLEQGLAEAEVISLHAGGVDTILDADAFSKMQPGVIILNSARAGLIDEAAFTDALDKGIVSQAWLDVFWEEPYQGALTKYPQVLMTPHVCTYTRQCRLGMEMQAVDNLLRDLGLGS